VLTDNEMHAVQNQIAHAKREVIAFMRSEKFDRCRLEFQNLELLEAQTALDAEYEMLFGLPKERILREEYLSYMHLANELYTEARVNGYAFVAFENIQGNRVFVCARQMEQAHQHIELNEERLVVNDNLRFVLGESWTKNKPIEERVSA